MLVLCFFIDTSRGKVGGVKVYNIPKFSEYTDSRKKPEVAPKRGLIALAVKATWRTKKKGQSLF